MSNSNLENCDFTGAKLNYTNFENCNLKNCIFNDADFWLCNITGANVTNAVGIPDCKDKKVINVED